MTNQEPPGPLTWPSREGAAHRNLCWGGEALPPPSLQLSRGLLGGLQIGQGIPPCPLLLVGVRRSRVQAWGSEQGPFPRSWVSLAGSQIGQQNPDKANAFPARCTARCTAHCPGSPQPQPRSGWVVQSPCGAAGRAISLLAAVLARGVTLLAGSTSAWRRLLQPLSSHQLITSPWALAPSQGGL